MHNGKLYIMAVTIVLVLLIVFLFYFKILGFRTLCGWDFPAQNNNYERKLFCKCLGIKFVDSSLGDYPREYCTGLNFSYNRFHNLSDNQNPVSNKDGETSKEKPKSTIPGAPSDDASKDTTGEIKNLTLDPSPEWVEDTACGITFKRHPQLKIVNKYKSGDGYKCNFWLREENTRKEIPYDFNNLYFYVLVHNDYDNGSRRDFYFRNKQSDDSSGDYYVGANEFVAGKNRGLAMMYKNKFTPGVFYEYIMAKDSKTLIEIGPTSSFREPETDILRMFLTSIK